MSVGFLSDVGLTLVASTLDQYWSILVQYWTNIFILVQYYTIIGQLFFAIRGPSQNLATRAGMPALFRQALFRQALFRQALFRQPLFRQALFVVNPLGERAITIRKAWESFGGGSGETSWLMKSLTGRVPKDRSIFRKRTIIQVKVTSRRSTKKRNTHLRWTE
jgi:hypothetical protein